MYENACRKFHVKLLLNSSIRRTSHTGIQPVGATEAAALRMGPGPPGRVGDEVTVVAI